MWIRFTADFNWKPRPAVTIAYKAGGVHNVTRACAARALAADKAERVNVKGKSDADTKAKHTD